MANPKNLAQNDGSTQVQIPPPGILRFKRVCGLLPTMLFKKCPSRFPRSQNRYVFSQRFRVCTIVILCQISGICHQKHRNAA